MSNPILYRKKTLLGKLEATYGVDSTPDGSNAIMTKNMSVNPYEGSRVSRDIDRASLGNDLEFNVGAHVTLSFDVEVAGAGTPGDVPAYGVLLRACGFSETVTAATKVDYQPVSGSFDSLVFYYVHENQLHKITGCRGTVSFSDAKGGMGSMSFTFTGLFNAPEEVGSPPVGVYSAWQRPVPFNKSNVPVYQIGAYDCVAESIDFDMSNDVIYRNVVGDESVQITNRAPSGKLKIQAPDLATKDFFAAVASHEGVTTETLKFQHGKTAGNIVEFNAPVVQLSSISFSESDGILHYDMDARLIPTDAGDDELLITVR